MVARSALVKSRGRVSNTRVEVPERVVSLASLRLCEMYPVPVTHRAYPMVVLSIFSASRHDTPLVACHTCEGISYSRVLVPVTEDDELNPDLLPTRDGVQQPRIHSHKLLLHEYTLSESAVAVMMHEALCSHR